jgi:hypothetical protein
MSDPIFSPDGQFMWTGSEWIPRPPEKELGITQSTNVTIKDSVFPGNINIIHQKNTTSSDESEQLHQQTEDTSITNEMNQVERILTGWNICLSRTGPPHGLPTRKVLDIDHPTIKVVQETLQKLIDTVEDEKQDSNIILTLELPTSTYRNYLISVMGEEYSHQDVLEYGGCWIMLTPQRSGRYEVDIRLPETLHLVGGRDEDIGLVELVTVGVVRRDLWGLILGVINQDYSCFNTYEWECL